MDDQTLLPRWATNKRTFLPVSVALGAAIAGLLILPAVIVPDALRDLVGSLFFPLLLIGLAGVTLLVISIRRMVVGPAKEQEIPPSPWLVGYILAAIPLCVAALGLGAIVTLALVFGWDARFGLVQSLVVLLFGFAILSMTIKLVLNAQMLVRHWSQP